jgi:hypothetical protein
MTFNLSWKILFSLVSFLDVKLYQIYDQLLQSEMFEYVLNFVPIKEIFKKYWPDLDACHIRIASKSRSLKVYIVVNNNTNSFTPNNNA